MVEVGIFVNGAAKILWMWTVPDQHWRAETIPTSTSLCLAGRLVGKLGTPRTSSSLNRSKPVLTLGILLFYNSEKSA